MPQLGLGHMTWATLCFLHNFRFASVVSPLGVQGFKVAQITRRSLPDCYQITVRLFGADARIPTLRHQDASRIPQDTTRLLPEHHQNASGYHKITNILFGARAGIPTINS